MPFSSINSASAGTGYGRVSVLGSQMTALRRSAIHQHLLAKARQRQGGYVCVANVHTTMMGFFYQSYKAITNGATFAVPDGMPLVWAMRSLGARGQDRVRGPSLMRDLVDQGRALGLKHYLYGATAETVRALQAALLKEYPGAEIVGAESPPFRPLEEVTKFEWAEIASRLNESGANCIWVGLGAPKQEIWMWKQRNAVQGLMLGVGAAFDLIPGRIPEAPRALQALGLEWTYRLFREPRRLWRRYLFNNPAFLVLWAGQWLLSLTGRSFASAEKIEPKDMP